MEFSAQSSWDQRISALRRMNDSVIYTDSNQPGSKNAKKTRARRSQNPANTRTKREAPRKQDAARSSGPTIIHVGKPKTCTQETSTENDLPALKKKEMELRPEEKEILDLFISQNNPTRPLHLVYGGNVSDIIQVQPPKMKDVPEVPEVPEDPEITEITEDPEVPEDPEVAAAPVWPELTPIKRELYTIPEVDDENDYTREEVMEIFLRQSKSVTPLGFIQGGNMANKVMVQPPKVKDVPEVPEVPEDPEITEDPEVPEVPGVSEDPEVAAAPVWPELTPIKRELYTIPELDDKNDYTREEIMEIFIRESKSATPLGFIQGGNMANKVMIQPLKAEKSQDN